MAVNNYPIPFGKYLLTERIAVGGMAEVFRATLRTIEGVEKSVALKRILPEYSVDEEFVALFIDEARISATLQHANIVQVFDFGKIEGSYYLAMEVVDGPNLKAFIRRFYQDQTDFPIEYAIYIIIQMLKALDYLYRVKDASGRPLFVIHRDISPQNILLSREGEVKITDFGIAKAASKLSKTQPGKIQGKFGYMSPEQALGKELDHRSDLFSLGIIFFEMLTGRRLYGGENTMVRFENVKEARIEPVSKYREISGEIDRIVLKMLAKNPAERYQSSSELQKDLADYLYPANVETIISSLSETIKAFFPKDFTNFVGNGGNGGAAAAAAEAPKAGGRLKKWWRRRRGKAETGAAGATESEGSTGSSSVESISSKPQVTPIPSQQATVTMSGSVAGAGEGESNVSVSGGKPEKTLRRPGSSSVMAFPGFGGKEGSASRSSRSRTALGSIPRAITRLLFLTLAMLGGYQLVVNGGDLGIAKLWGGKTRTDLMVEHGRLAEENRRLEKQLNEQRLELDRLQHLLGDLQTDQRGVMGKLEEAEMKRREVERLLNREQDRWDQERKGFVAELGGVKASLAEATSKCPKEMSYVKPGPFFYGSREDDPERNLGEIAATMVQAKGFCIDPYEFPNQAGIKPRVTASWYEANQACEVMGKRLCSEREWERACKGPKGWRYTYGDTWNEKACNTEDKRGNDGKLMVAGSNGKCLNEFGVFDMSGNAAEWTETAGSIQGSGVVKGGAFDRAGYWSRCAARLETMLDKRQATVGFRCCKDVR